MKAVATTGAFIKQTGEYGLTKAKDGVSTVGGIVDRKTTGRWEKNTARIMRDSSDTTPDPSDGIVRNIDYLVATLKGQGKTKEARALEGNAKNYNWGDLQGDVLAKKFKYIDAQIDPKDINASGHLATTYLMRVCALMKKSNEALMKAADRRPNENSELFLRDAFTYFMTALQYVSLARLRTSPELTVDTALVTLQKAFKDLKTSQMLNHVLSDNVQTENYEDFIKAKMTELRVATATPNAKKPSVTDDDFALSEDEDEGKGQAGGALKKKRAVKSKSTASTKPAAKKSSTAKKAAPKKK